MSGQLVKVQTLLYFIVANHSRYSLRNQTAWEEVSVIADDLVIFPSFILDIPEVTSTW
jgi:hypothetical protein